MDRKIKAIRTYQAIQFDGRQETHFTTISSLNKKAVELKFMPEFMAIEITSEKDNVIVPLTNISGIYLWAPRDDERVTAQKVEAENVASKTGLKPHQTKGKG